MVSVQLHCRSWWYMLNDVQNYDYVDKLWLYRWTINIAEIFCMFIPSLFPDPIWERDWFIPCNPHISLHYISVWTEKMNARWTCYTNRNLVKSRPTQVTSCINSCSQTVRLAGDPLLTIASSYMYSCSIELAEKFECVYHGFSLHTRMFICCQTQNQYTLFLNYF